MEKIKSHSNDLTLTGFFKIKIYFNTHNSLNTQEYEEWRGVVGFQKLNSI